MCLRACGFCVCACVCVRMVNWVEEKTDLGHAVPMSTSGRLADMSDVGERGGGGGAGAGGAGGERACSQTAERPGVRGGQNQCTMTHLSPCTLTLSPQEPCGAARTRAVTCEAAQERMVRTPSNREMGEKKRWKNAHLYPAGHSVARTAENALKGRPAASLNVVAQQIPYLPSL